MWPAAFLPPVRVGGLLRSGGVWVFTMKDAVTDGGKRPLHVSLDMDAQNRTARLATGRRRGFRATARSGWTRS